MAQGPARRQFLRSLAAGAASISVPSLVGEQAKGSPQYVGGDGFIIRELDPQNYESTATAFSTFLTPTDRFYVRSHFKQPDISVATWSLAVDGAVTRPLNITYAELRAMPFKRLVSMLECAGNGRAYLSPKADGVQWANGGMGNAEWTGVPLAEVLKRVEVSPSAVDVVFEGSDLGELNTPDPKSPGPIHFAHSIPFTEAMRGDALLAFQMNGKDLTPAHGFPVRLVVPGSYGMASVKWLKRMTITTKPFNGYFQTLQYSYFDRSEDLPTLKPLASIGVKSTIVHPSFGQTIPIASVCKITGLAWAGPIDVVSVEVSTDGGASWHNAQFMSEPVPYSWRMWEYSWTPSAAGTHKLMTRARDAKGNTQPMERNKDLRSYQIHHVVPITVQVVT